jgi:hypothetical protein
MVLKVDENSVVYKNEYYTVIVQPEGSVDLGGVMYDGILEAVNNLTGLIEIRHPSLPVVLHNVERCSLDLEQETHLELRNMQRQIEFTPDDEGGMVFDMPPADSEPN